MQPVLALNASMEPLQPMPLKMAVRLVYQGKAELVEGDESRMLRAEGYSMPYPLVIRLNKLVKVPRKFRRKVSNQFLFARDGYRCQYCGRHERELGYRESLTRDHVQPLSRGGANEWSNVVTACSTCNWRKADRTPSEAGMALRTVPTEPDMVVLRWSMRRLTSLQLKYVKWFYGEEWQAAVDQD